MPLRHFVAAVAGLWIVALISGGCRCCCCCYLSVFVRVFISMCERDGYSTISAVAVVCVVFGPMVRARLWASVVVNCTISLRRLRCLCCVWSLEVCPDDHHYESTVLSDSVCTERDAVTHRTPHSSCPIFHLHYPSTSPSLKSPLALPKALRHSWDLVALTPTSC